MNNYENPDGSFNWLFYWEKYNEVSPIAKNTIKKYQFNLQIVADCVCHWDLIDTYVLLDEIDISLDATIDEKNQCLNALRQFVNS